MSANTEQLLVGKDPKSNFKKYSLNCKWYDRSFSTIDKLVDDVVRSGSDPNYEITENGKVTDELLSDYLIF